MLIVEFHPEHRPREHGLDAPFYFNVFFFHGCTVSAGSGGDGNIPETGQRGRSQKVRGPVGPGLAKKENGELVAVATAPAWAAVAAISTTAAAGGAFLARPRDVDRQCPAAQFLAV